MINEAINKLAEKQNLTGAETIGAFGEIMSGEATNAQIAAFITAMRMKGETIEEITACAKVLREKCTHIDPGKDVLDIVGTGGDCANTFNISTTSSFVIAAAGVPVAKHGNRSVSSKSGAADVLEELGVKIDLSAERNKELLQEIDLCFLFAQALSLVLMLFAVKRLRSSYTAYFLAYFIVAVGATWLLSAPRYIAAAFTVPTALAVITHDRRVDWCLTTLSVLAGAVYLCEFVLRWQVW